MALSRERGTPPHVPMVFFLPFYSLILDVDVDSRGVFCSCGRYPRRWPLPVAVMVAVMVWP